MKFYTLRNYNPMFGLNIQKFDGKWGFYLDLGHHSLVFEQGRPEKEF